MDFEQFKKEFELGDKSRDCGNCGSFLSDTTDGKNAMETYIAKSHPTGKCGEMVGRGITDVEIRVYRKADGSTADIIMTCPGKTLANGPLVCAIHSQRAKSKE